MNRKAEIKKKLGKLDSLQKLNGFLGFLGLKTFAEPQNPSLEVFDFRKPEREAVDSVYLFNDYEETFRTYLIKTDDEPSTTLYKSIPELFRRSFRYPFLIFTNDFRHYTFVLVERNRISRGEFKTKVIKLDLDIENVKRTPVEVFNDINVDGINNPRKIFDELNEAFDVEAVTQNFFENYKDLFNDLKESFLSQYPKIEEPKRNAHEYTHQLLNRIMFIYFVQKKGWLGENLNFIEDFWDEYRKASAEEKSFHKDWIEILFFEAFNDKFSRKKHFPDSVNSTLQLAPYLNGGLFQRNKLDRIGYKVTDSQFREIFEFFSHYNFTIEEDTPLEKNVAVNPEMIGKVYESLVNISEEGDTRAEAGIFYTSRIEIDLMVKKSLTEYLTKNSDVSRELIIKLLFSGTEEQKRTVEKELHEEGSWGQIKEALDDLNLLDPACGSGSFLIGALDILADLYSSFYKFSPRSRSSYELKKEIIQRSLYGVDVMEWAVHVAELRLWLQLVIESDMKAEEVQFEPLLPNLSFKLRQGDSLIQEAGGVDLANRGAENQEIPRNIKRRITSLAKEKVKFYRNEKGGKYDTKVEIEKEELDLFRDLFYELKRESKEEIKTLKRQTYSSGKIQELFDGEFAQAKKSGKELFEEQREQKLKNLEKQIAQYNEVLGNLPKSTNNLNNKPFVWDMDFPEIFMGEEALGGFDIVIGNPPYVQQEDIKPPLLDLPEDSAPQKEKDKFKAKKKEYKKKLKSSVINSFGDKYSPSGRSDLYVYFYFHGLDLLNEKGTFCFITSNSWLDVGYGKTLQEFLLDNVDIKEIVDNSAKRSFADADVNTVITILDPPKKKIHEGMEYDPLDNKARFTVFKKPFSDVINVKNMLETDEFKNLSEADETRSIETEGVSFDIARCDEYRLVRIKQKSLKELSWERDEKAEKEFALYNFSNGKYKGDKWGGKFLRGPDIFFTILAKGNLVQLKRVANFEGYIHDNNTGGDYPEVKFIKSSRNAKQILLTENAPGVNMYGVTTKGNSRIVADMLFPRTINDRHLVLMNYGEVYGKEFYKILVDEDNKDSIGLFLNSTLGIMQREILGTQNLGLGGLKFRKGDLKAFYVFDDLGADSQAFEDFLKREQMSVFDELGFNENKPIREQKPSPKKDRKSLDDRIFKKLDLKKEEKDEVYFATAELVQQRLSKAKSV